MLFVLVWVPDTWQCLEKCPAVLCSYQVTCWSGFTLVWEDRIFDFLLVAMPFPGLGYETFFGPVLVVDQPWCTPAIVVHVFV